MSDKPIKTREDLALGSAHPKTGKRSRGYLAMYRVMPQYRDKLISGEMSEDDLIEKAFQKADEEIAKRLAGPGEEPQTFTEEDATYRAEQEERYRTDYEWNSSNDEAQLQRLLDLEVQSRATNREFAKANLNVKDRTALLGELRNIAKDLAALQKGLGIDRPTRENRKRTEDPMEALRIQQSDGANFMRNRIAEAPSYAERANTIEELRAFMKHSLGRPYDAIDPFLEAHRRILGISVSSDSTDVVEE